MHTQRNSTYTYIPMQKYICIYVYTYVCLDSYAEKLKRKNLHARQRGAKQMKRTRIAWMNKSQKRPPSVRDKEREKEREWEGERASFGCVPLGCTFIGSGRCWPAVLGCSTDSFCAWFIPFSLPKGISIFWGNAWHIQEDATRHIYVLD